MYRRIGLCILSIASLALVSGYALNWWRERSFDRSLPSLPSVQRHWKLSEDGESNRMLFVAIDRKISPEDVWIVVNGVYLSPLTDGKVWDQNAERTGKWQILTTVSNKSAGTVEVRIYKDSILHSVDTVIDFSTEGNVWWVEVTLDSEGFSMYSDWRPSFGGLI